MDSQIGVLSQWTEIKEQTIREIINCESGFNVQAKNVNKNKSVDLGLFQINSVHRKEMEKAGLNPLDPTDNLAFGFYLGAKDGIDKHWKSSKNCWDKKSIVKANMET